MKLFFSTVLVAAPGGEVLTYWESGHPDEYDIWELITRDARYRKAAELLEESVEVRVSHYIYETESPGPDAHAEQKRKLYAEYQRVRRDMQEVNTAKANIDYLLGYAGQDKKKEQER